MQAQATVGLSLHGWLMDAAEYKKLEERLKCGLRVLQMSECLNQPGPLPVNRGCMQWLSVGATTSVNLGLTLEDLPLVRTSFARHCIFIVVEVSQVTCKSCSQGHVSVRLYVLQPARSQSYRYSSQHLCTGSSLSPVRIRK